MYFAQIDQNNKVINVIVADQAFIDTLPGNWVATDINGVSPVNYAGIGYTWNPSLNGFVPPQPFPSWTLDKNTVKWVAPVAMPTSGGPYIWNETQRNWVAVSG